MDAEEPSCCKESCMVVYHYGVTVAHCYRGTHECWEEAAATGYFDLNSSYMIVGATDSEAD